jgi:hypothetical protein
MKKLSALLIIMCFACFACQDAIDLKAPNEDLSNLNGTLPSNQQITVFDPYRWSRLSDLNMAAVGQELRGGDIFKVNGNVYCRRWFTENSYLNEKTFKFNKSTKQWDAHPIDLNQFLRDFTYFFSQGNFMYGVDYQHRMAMFNIVTGQFEWRAPFPGETYTHVSAVRIGTDGYVLGGMQYGGDHVWGVDQYWKYDFVRDRWTDMGPLPGGGRGYSSAFVVGTKIYFGLGMSSQPQSVWDDYIYSALWIAIDPSNNTYSWQSPHPAGLGMAKGFVIDDKIYVGWGWNRGYPGVKFWQFNPEGNKWTEKTNPGFSGDIEAFSIEEKGYAMSFENEQFWQYADRTAINQLP